MGTTSSPTSWWSYHASSSSEAAASSIHRIARTSSSAAVRSSTPSKKATGWEFIQRNSRTVSGFPCQGEDSGTWRVNVAPGTKRPSGSSVYSSSLSAPFRPCALTRRPTRNCVLEPTGGRASPEGATSVIRDVDPHTAAIGERGDERAQRLGGASAAPDHASAVIGVHVHLEDIPS